MGICWEYPGTILGMKLIFTDDNDCRRERLWELHGNDQGKNLQELIDEKSLKNFGQKNKA